MKLASNKTAQHKDNSTQHITYSIFEVGKQNLLVPYPAIRQLTTVLVCMYVCVCLCRMQQPAPGKLRQRRPLPSRHEWKN
jgi:hypothetical protein